MILLFIYTYAKRENMAIVNQINIEAVEGKEKDLKQVLNSLVALSLEQKACQKYELYQLEDKRKTFFIIEIWKNEKKKTAYYESKQYLEISENISKLSLKLSSNSLKLPQCLTKLGLK